jgi:pheromone shutdown protein TraB
MIDGSSIMGKMAGFMLSMISATPESRAMLRVMVIEMLGHADVMLAVKMPADMNKLMGVIVEERNQVVLADLRKLIQTEPGVKSVAIIYGAGHLPGMERSLVTDFGYAPAGDTWRTAMEVDSKEAGLSADRIRSIREMFSKMMSAQAELQKPKKPKPDPDPKTN